MRNIKLEDFIKMAEDCPSGRDSSVHYSDFRFQKADEEAKKMPVAKDIIITYVNEFLGEIGIPAVASPLIKSVEVDYAGMKKSYHLDNEQDIVWMKFTTDGYLGVVAVSNDINFDSPNTREEYDLKISGTWVHNTSGIIVHYLGKCWDHSNVMVFPLQDIPKGLNRHDIECGIGNYLIHKGVPILDYYSHNY